MSSWKCVLLVSPRYDCAELIFFFFVCLLFRFFVLFCLVFFFFLGGGGGVLSRRRLHILCFFLYENNFWKLRQAKFSLDTDILQFALEAAKHKQGRENEKFSSFINY